MGNNRKDAPTEVVGSSSPEKEKSQEVIKKTPPSHVNTSSHVSATSSAIYIRHESRKAQSKVDAGGAASSSE